MHQCPNMDMSEEYDSSKAENTSGPSRSRGTAKIISARLQGQMWDTMWMPNFMMMVHETPCTICQSYGEHVVNASKFAQQALWNLLDAHKVIIKHRVAQTHYLNKHQNLSVQYQPNNLVYLSTTNL